MLENGMGGESATWSRRTLMKALAAGGSIGALAGCMSGDGSGDDDQYFVLPAIGNLEQAHFNMWSLDHELFYEQRLLWDGFAHFSNQTVEWYPELATDWEFDMNDYTVTLELRDDVEWHDGTAYTADHAVNHFLIAKVWGDPIWDFATDVHAPGEYTLEIEFDPVAKSIIEPVILGDMWSHWLHTHPELHREFIERAEDATTDDELTEINEDLANFSIDGEEAIEAGLGHGPVELVEVTNSRMVMEPYDGYPVGWDEGNDMNWAGFEIVDFGDSGSDWHEAAIADNIDGFTGNAPGEVRSSMGDHWEILNTPQDGYQSMLFSPDSIWGQNTEESRALRQAIAYVYDPTEYVEIFGEEILDYPDPNNVTGLNTVGDEAWLGDVLDGFTNYGNSDAGWVQEEQAEQKMEAAGFERDDDRWVEADTGDSLEVEIVYPVDYNSHVPSYENVIEQFDRFGIEAEGVGEDSTTLLTQQLPANDFEVALFTTSLGPHPLAAYRSTIGNVSEPDTTRWNNQLSEVDVPWPPGDEDNDVETVNIDDRIEALAGATEDDDVQELVEELAWIYNQWVHGVQTCTEFRLNYVATDDWEWSVDMDDPKMLSEQPWVYLARSGELRAKSE